METGRVSEISRTTNSWLRAGFEQQSLDAEHRLFIGWLPDHLRLNNTDFEELWQRHPDKHHLVRTPIGTYVEIPRWQAAEGADYHFSGTSLAADAVSDSLRPLLEWSRSLIDQRLNGILINWYNGRQKHYIGKHHDSVKHMHRGAPIVTISFGESRVFRLRPAKVNNEFEDFPISDGSVVIMPYATNTAYKHEVPHHAHNTGRRISVTLRAFTQGVVE